MISNVLALESLVGEQVKVVTQEPGNTAPTIIFCTIEGLDKQFLIIRSRDGVGCISLDHIITVKPLGDTPEMQEANRFIRELQSQLTPTEYNRYKEQWLPLRQTIKKIYIMRIKGGDWKQYARENFGGDAKDIIQCIETGMPPKGLFTRMDTQKVEG